MRRYTFFAASLAGLTTLLAGATAMGGPPGKKHPRGATQVNTNGGNITIIVNPPAQPPTTDASPAAEKAEKVPATDKAQKLSQNDKEKASKADESAADRAKRGVVVIERAGEVVGLGTVLANDGRVLTALSPLGDGNNLDLRYADGTTSHAKVGHSDRLWDLAMLVPAAGKWPEGLQASEQDPLAKGSKLSSFAPAKAGKVLLAPMSVKSKKSLLGADETLLRDVFEVNKVGPKELGGPIIDDHGDVVGVLGRACVPIEKGPCAPTPFGVPVPALRGFLSKAPPSALAPMQPPPWLGVQGTAEKGPVQGVKVTGVAPESPAEDAGVKAPADKNPGDVIVAVDDQPVSTPEALSKQIHQKSPGDRVKLLLFGNGKFRESTLVLKPAPQKK